MSKPAPILSYTRPPIPKPSHSGWVSFIAGVLAISLQAMAWLTLSPILIGATAILSPLIALWGLPLGIVGIRHRGDDRDAAIAGIVLNSLVFAVIVMAFVILLRHH